MKKRLEGPGSAGPSVVIGWRAWYTNERVFDSKITHWKFLPKDGVITIMLFLNKRNKTTKFPLRRQMYGDYYWYVPEKEIYGCCYYPIMLPNGKVLTNAESPKDILNRYPGAIILRGQWVSEQELEKINKESMETRFL